MQHADAASQGPGEAEDTIGTQPTNVDGSKADFNAPHETDDPESSQLREKARNLADAVQQVTPEEFRWQDSHYAYDSARGRELLFLIANHEWVRATSEVIDVNRSDAIDTTIKIDIDLEQIIHEAFRERTGRLWLPVIILPRQAGADVMQELNSRQPEPDPFATVIDAAGELLAILPDADFRHQVSAAMAEIIVNMAVAHWPGREKDWPTATRDQRLLLSAAIYRVLRPASASQRVGEKSDIAPTAEISMSQTASPASGADARAYFSRIDNARHQLFKLLSLYIGLLDKMGRDHSPRIASRW